MFAQILAPLCEAVEYNRDIFITLLVIAGNPEMFLTSISMSCSSWYLSVAFLSNVSCFSAGPPVLGLTCTDLAIFSGFSAYLTACMAACVMACYVFIFKLPFLFSISDV